MKRDVILFCFLSMAAAGCHLTEPLDRQFGDQNFKTAISLVELHRVRFGKYPDTLDDLKYTGDWDRIAIGSVDYRKLDDGYRLDLVRGWVGFPETLEYPVAFYRGLGLKESNVLKKK